MDTNKKKAMLYTCGIILLIALFSALVITVPGVVLGVTLTGAVLGFIYIIYLSILEHLDDRS